MIHALAAWADARGLRVAAGPGRILNEVRAEVSERITRGELSQGFVEKWLGWINEGDLKQDDAGGTLVVIATPSPALPIRFTLPDRIISTRIPPTYAEDSGADKEMEKQLAVALSVPPDAVRRLHAPCKPLGARLGLTMYGRNNITYAPGLGSYIRLGVFLVHIPWAAAAERSAAEYPAARTMPECETCTACRDACPTDAIGEERFLIKAERCIVFHNEFPGAWPAWIPVHAHNCLVGCMLCQEACPQNAGLLTVSGETVFDRDETEAILHDQSGKSSAIRDSIKSKLTAIHMDWLENILGRNTAALL
jgi:epoxyqueuosine reductase